MDTFLAGTGLFVIGFVFHLILWRVRVPTRQLATLFVLFGGVALMGFASALAFGLGNFALSPLRLLLALLLFGSYAVVYLILFTALEADSPTLTILNLIQARGRQGVTDDELVRAVAHRSYARVRLDQMLRDGMAIKSNERLFPGRQGHLLTTLILGYRKLLGRDTFAGSDRQCNI